jgi:CRP/FNR family transcriptional regulator
MSRPSDRDATAALAARIAERYPELPLPPGPDGGPAIGLPSAPLQVPAGSVLFEERAPCRGFPLVLSGDVRVARGTPGGRSIELYRVGPGEICVVSAASLFGSTPLPAHGVTTAASELVLLGAEAFEGWTSYAPFRRYVFGLFADRLADVITLAEAVAFQRLDQRLAAALLGHGAVVAATHQAIADELGTVREIVTRLLRRFERSGWVALARERVELLDPAALRRLASGAPPDAAGGQ